MKFIPMIAVVLWGLLISGCVSDFQVETPAQEEALQQLLRRMETAVNPDQAPLPGAFRCRYSTVTRQLGMSMTGEMICTMTPFRLCNAARMPGMPQVVELFDGTKGYSIIEETSMKELEGPELMQLVFLGELNWTPDLRKVFDPLTLDQNFEEVGGKAYFRLVGTPQRYPELGTMEFLIDPDTALIYRMKYAVHTSFGKIPVENYCYDYRKFGTMILAARTVTKTLGDEVETIIAEVTTDPVLPPDAFDAEKWFGDEDDE